MAFSQYLLIAIFVTINFSKSSEIFLFQHKSYTSRIFDDYLGFPLQAMGVQLIGLCCGNMPAFTRTMAETLGRSPPASAYSPDMSGHRSDMMRKEWHKYNPA